MDYSKYDFKDSTDLYVHLSKKGLSKDTVIAISKMKDEPQWMLDFRLKAFERFKQLKEPDWQKPKYPKIDYQDLYYYSAPKSMDDKPKSLDELDPKAPRNPRATQYKSKKGRKYNDLGPTEGRY